jgi:hypothetical protein
VPVTTIYSWRYRREGPPGFRVGRHVRFRWTDIERWIDAQMARELDVLNPATLTTRSIPRTRHPRR